MTDLSTATSIASPADGDILPIRKVASPGLLKISLSQIASYILGNAGVISAFAGKQGVNANLTAISGLVSAANKVAYYTGSGTASLADLTAFARTLLDDADAATMLATLKAGGLSHPGYVAGRYYWLPALGAINTSVAPGLNTLRLTPFLISQPITVAELFARIVTANAGNVRLGIYASDPATHLPSGAPLMVCSDISTAAVANLSSAVVGGSVLLPPGYYWQGAMADNATAAIAACVPTVPRYSSLQGSTSLANMVTSSVAFYISLSIAVTYGTWPNLTTTPASEVANGPEVIIGIKAA